MICGYWPGTPENRLPPEWQQRGCASPQCSEALSCNDAAAAAPAHHQSPPHHTCQRQQGAPALPDSSDEDRSMGSVGSVAQRINNRRWAGRTQVNKARLLRALIINVITCIVMNRPLEKVSAGRAGSWTRKENWRESIR